MHHDRETEVRHEQDEIDKVLSHEDALEQAVLYAKNDLNDADTAISMENLSVEVHKGLTAAAKTFYQSIPGSAIAKEQETVIGRLVLAQILEDLIDGQ